MFEDARDLRHRATGLPHVDRKRRRVPRARASRRGVKPVSKLAHLWRRGGELFIPPTREEEQHNSVNSRTSTIVQISAHERRETRDAGPNRKGMKRYEMKQRRHDLRFAQKTL